jgi:hypothetical protein
MAKTKPKTTKPIKKVVSEIEPGVEINTTEPIKLINEEEPEKVECCKSFIYERMKELSKGIEKSETFKDAEKALMEGKTIVDKSTGISFKLAFVSVNGDKFMEVKSFGKLAEKNDWEIV